jgi:2-polyprenyl-3-methyl-5-hydroxy-6-metoxy-1,4-benzoquinol methylase
VTESEKFWRNNKELKNIYPIRANKGEYPDNQLVLDAVTYYCIGRVLDYGCGFGRLAHLFSDDKYVGVDINQHAIGEAMRRHPQKRFAHVLNSPPDFLAELSVDTVLCYAVLPHIDDEIKKLKTIRWLCQFKRLVIAERLHARDPRVPVYAARDQDYYRTNVPKSFLSSVIVDDWCVMCFDDA